MDDQTQYNQYGVPIGKLPKEKPRQANRPTISAWIFPIVFAVWSLLIISIVASDGGWVQARAVLFGVSGVALTAIIAAISVLCGLPLYGGKEFQLLVIIVSAIVSLFAIVGTLAFALSGGC